MSNNLTSIIGIAGILVASISATSLFIKVYVVDDKNIQIDDLKNEVGSFKDKLQKVIIDVNTLNIQVKALQEDALKIRVENENGVPNSIQQANSNADSIIIGSGSNVGNITKSENDKERINYAVNNLKNIFTKECKRYKNQFDRIFESRKRRHVFEGSFNPYSLPKFSASLKNQVTTNPHLIQSSDPKVTEMIMAVGNIDYEHTFSLKRGNGEIYKVSIRPYVLNLHYACDWASVDLGYRDVFE